MRIVGNLDVEVTWARMDAAARRARGEKAPSPDDPRFALPEAVMRKISAAATLLRVFAPPTGDAVIWTPRPVDPARMALDTFWMPKVRLESGPMPTTADVWWGVPTETAARVNHRLFAWEAMVRRGIPRLPGGTVVFDVENLRRAAGEMLDRSGERPWVAKAPLSAAGRLRVRGVGELEDKQRVQAGRLLDLYGVLLFEPWMDRVADFGIGGQVVAGGRVDVHGIHGLDVDGGGRFVGIRDAAPDIGPQAGVAIGVATVRMGEALRDAGYVGGFTIDGFTYRAGAEPGLQRVSEVNARNTFGDVAARIIDMARDTISEAATAERISLRFGKGPPPAGTIPLLLPGADDETSAWLDVGAPRAA